MGLKTGIHDTLIAENTKPDPVPPPASAPVERGRIYKSHATCGGDVIVIYIETGIIRESESKREQLRSLSLLIFIFDLYLLWIFRINRKRFTSRFSSIEKPLSWNGERVFCNPP